MKNNPEVLYATLALLVFTLISTGLAALAVDAVIGHVLGSLASGL